MIFVVLSIGAVWAFIPIVVIIILILAARTSTGKDLFGLFGLSSILGYSRGVGGGGAGKGITKGSAYKTTTASDSPGSDTATAAAGGLAASVPKQNADTKLKLMDDMTTAEIVGMCQNFGMKPDAAMDRDGLQAYVISHLSTLQVSNYYHNIDIDGKLSSRKGVLPGTGGGVNPPPPRAPSSAANPEGRVRLSVSDWYKAYYRRRPKKQGDASSSKKK